MSKSNRQLMLFLNSIYFMRLEISHRKHWNLLTNLKNGKKNEKKKSVVQLLHAQLVYTTTNIFMLHKLKFQTYSLANSLRRR